MRQTWRCAHITLVQLLLQLSSVQLVRMAATPCLTHWLCRNRMTILSLVSQGQLQDATERANQLQAALLEAEAASTEGRSAEPASAPQPLQAARAAEKQLSEEARTVPCSQPLASGASQELPCDAQACAQPVSVISFLAAALTPRRTSDSVCVFGSGWSESRWQQA